MESNNSKTVGEFIEYLKTLDQENLVMTRGYERGFCDVGDAELKEIRKNVHSEWYYGPHDEADYYSADKEAPIFKAYII